MALNVDMARAGGWWDLRDHEQTLEGWRRPPRAAHAAPPPQLSRPAGRHPSTPPHHHHLAPHHALRSLRYRNLLLYRLSTRLATLPSLGMVRTGFFTATTRLSLNMGSWRWLPPLGHGLPEHALRERSATPSEYLMPPCALRCKTSCASTHPLLSRELPEPDSYATGAAFRQLSFTPGWLVTNVSLRPLRAQTVIAIGRFRVAVYQQPHR